MSIGRTLLLIGLTLIVTCVIIKACNAGTSDSLKVLPTSATDSARLADTNPAAAEQIMEYKGFTVSFNRDVHLPNWVSWELLGSETNGTATRKGKKFFQDRRIDGCPTPADYSGTGYSRGHMAPLADMKWSENAANQCFTMANMCPQLQILNGGTWGKLEEKCRIWAVRDSALLIVAGPILTPAPDEYIGDSNVAVPKAFFKVIAAPWANPPRGIGFIMPNGKVPGGLQAAAVTIDSIEALTGHNFFPNMPDSLQDIIESKAKFHKWNNSK